MSVEEGGWEGEGGGADTELKTKTPHVNVWKKHIYIYGSIYHRIESNSNMNLIAIIGIDKELGSEKPNGRR